MLKRATIIFGLALAPACSDFEQVNAKQRDFLQMVQEETAVNVRRLAAEADSIDFSSFDLPVASMETGSDPVLLTQEDLRLRLLALPDIVDQFDIKEQVRMVDSTYCGEYAGACVHNFDYSGFAQNEANLEDIVEESEGVFIYVEEEGLNNSICHYNNPELIVTPFETISPEYDKGMIFCIWVGMLGHELLHTAGLGHNEESYGSLSDASYVFGGYLNGLCMQPYDDTYRDL